MPQLAAQIWADGPASTPTQPLKLDIRAWGTWLEQIVGAFTSTGGLLYTSRAALYADLAHAAPAMAWVLGDPTAGYNGIYVKSGISGSGSWSRVGDLPYSFIVASDAGAGTPNAIQATSAIPVSESSLVVLSIAVTSTASPVTVSFNGNLPLTIKTNTGNDPTAGGLVAGMRVFGTISGSTFRLVSDQVSTAIVANAEAALNQIKALYIGPFASDTLASAAGPVEGTFYENTTTATLRYYHSGAWQTIPYATAADDSITEAKLNSVLKGTLIKVVPDRATMRALDTSVWTSAHLASIGLFGWDATDLAAQMITVQRNVTFHNVNTVANQLQYTDFPTGIPTPISSHGFVTGDPVYLPVATDGLAADTIFYVIKISESNIKLASSKANAIAGAALTLTGTADMALQVLRDIGQIRYVLKVGAKLNGSQGAWRAINAKSSSGDGWTRVFPPNSDWARANGTGVRLPDGTALDTTGTTTQGIQEAINFSCGNGKRGSGNSDLEITGGIEKTGNYQQDGGVVYNCVGGLQFPAIENKRIKGGSLTLNLAAYGTGTGAGLTFDSAMMCDIDMMALNLVYFGTGHCIRFDARTPVPADGVVFGVTAITGCQFKFQALSSAGSATGTLGAVVGIYANTASINLNDFLFSELNGGDGAAFSRLAYCVADPSAGGAVTENYIKIINIHNCSSGIQDGLSASGRVTGNHYEFTAQGNGLGGEALSSFATNSSYELSVPGGFTNAVNMQIGALGNVLIGKGPIIGTLLNSGGGTNRLYRAKQRAVGAQSVAASPVAFQNTTFEQVSLAVNGGTVSNISLKTAAGVTVSTGLTQGLFALEPYESLVITYTAAPSVNLLS